MINRNLLVFLLVVITSLITLSVSAQALTGEKTIGSGGDYTTFTAAINALNTNGVGAGGVIFNVLAGSMFSENTPAITATGTVDDPISFRKSGTGNNPKITPTGTAGTSDAGIIISGGDYITFDGIDINSSAVTTVEYGYLIRNASATNGAQHITIKNTNITMNNSIYMNTSLYCSAIFQTSNSIGGGVTATAASGANSYNGFYNLNIQNAVSGVTLYGSSTTYRDTDCEIGTLDNATRNTFNNLGAAGIQSESRGVYFYRSTNFKVFNTDITNIRGGVSTDIMGIRAFEYYGLNYIYNNNISSVINTGGSGSRAVGIWLQAETGWDPSTYIYNNTIVNLRCSSTSTSGYGVIGMWLGLGGNTNNEYFYVNNNTISIGYGQTPACNTIGIVFAGWISEYYVQNNVIANYAAPNTMYTPQSRHYGIYSYYRWLADGFTDWNVYYTPNGYIGIADGWESTTITSWQGLVQNGEEAHSIYTNPHFYNPDSDVHSSAGFMMNLTGYTYPAYLTYDMDYQLRNSGTFAGADVFVPFDDSSTITAPVTQVPAGIISSISTTVGTATDVFRFKLTDLGPDGQDTKVKTIKITNAYPSNPASWSSYLNGALLKVNGTPVVASNTTITASNITFTIAEGNLVIPENSSIEVTLAVYLKLVAIPEGLSLKFMIPMIHGCDTYSWNTRFVPTLSADVVSNEILLEVIGTQYVLSDVPLGAVMDNYFRLTVTAKDILGNVDTNIDDTVTLSLHTGTGTLSSASGLSSLLYSGTWSWIDLSYNTFETIKIKVTGSLPEVVTGWIVVAPYAQVPWALTAGQSTTIKYYPFVGSQAWGRTASLYTYNEITTYRSINALSWNVSTGGSVSIPSKIYLKQYYGALDQSQTWESLISSATEVYNGTLSFTTSGWKKIPLTTPFNYSGGGLLILVESDCGIYANQYSSPRFVASSMLSSMYQLENSGSGSPSVPQSLLSSNYRTDVRIHFNTLGMYESSTTTQSSTDFISGNTQNQQIICAEITGTGTLSPIVVNSLTFNTTGSSNLSYISAAKVFYTTTPTFATDVQYGSTITNLGSKGSFTVSQNKVIPVGTSYFWLCYDIAVNPPVGTTFDAQCTSVRVGNTDYTPTVTDPAGNRAVMGKKVSSVQVYQTGSGVVSSGTDNLSLLRLSIDVEPGSDAQSYATLPLNSVIVTGKNTNNSDVSAVKLYRGGGFSNQLGSTLTIAGGSATFSSLNYDLPLGTTDVYVYFNISSSAGVGNTIDAKILANAINIAGDTFPATLQDPAGEYTIQNVNYGGGYAAQGGYYFANTLADPAPSMPTFNWIDISATGTNSFPEMSSDDGAAPNNASGYDIGFNFPFYGQSYSKFWIGADGAIYFVRPTFPPPMGINGAFVALYSADFHPASPNYPKTILYKQVDGTLVVTYLKCQPKVGASADTYLTGQIILYPTGKIKLQYLEKGSLTTLNTGFTAIANLSLSAYHLYNQAGSGGPLFSASPIAVAYGQNAYMLSDNVAENDLPTPASGTPTINFPITGATVEFTTATAATNLTAIRVETNPGGTLPDGILSLANRHWTINSTATSGLGNYNLTLDLNGIANLPGETQFYLVKREHVNSPWTNIGIPTSYNSVLKLATWQITTGFSDFGIGYESNGTLPVELSSFSAVATTLNSVTLQWTTQSETNLSGYYVYRSSQQNLDTAINLNSFIPATNGSTAQQYLFTDDELIEAGTYYYWLQSLEINGSSQFFGSVAVTIQGGGNVPPPTPLVTSFDSIYPNPFNPDATIKFSMKDAATMSLAIYNVRGQLVKQFPATSKPAGLHSLHWNGLDDNNKEVSSGLYFFIMQVGKETFYRKATIVK
jgi:hypothetical protein